MKKFWWSLSTLGIAATACGIAVQLGWLWSSPEHWLDRKLYCSKRLLTVKDRYPSHLSQSEQVQAVIFESLARERTGCEVAGDEPLMIFLSAQTEWAGEGSSEPDVSPPVLDYIRRAFPFTRNGSAVEPLTFEHLQVTERGTDRVGVILRVAPVEVSDDGPITVYASYFINGMASERIAFKLQRRGGRWTIIDRRMLWVS